MSKFKVGDKVVRVRPSQDAGMDVGVVYTVEKTKPGLAWSAPPYEVIDLVEHPSKNWFTDTAFELANPNVVYASPHSYIPAPTFSWGAAPHVVSISSGVTIAPFIKTSAPCEHSWRPYVGVLDRYDFCTKCDEKRNVQ